MNNTRFTLIAICTDEGFFQLIKQFTIPAAWLGIEKQDS